MKKIVFILALMLIAFSAQAQTHNAVVPGSATLEAKVLTPPTSVETEGASNWVVIDNQVRDLGIPDFAAATGNTYVFTLGQPQGYAFDFTVTGPYQTGGTTTGLVLNGGWYYASATGDVAITAGTPYTNIPQFGDGLMVWYYLSSIDATAPAVLPGVSNFEVKVMYSIAGL